MWNPTSGLALGGNPPNARYGVRLVSKGTLLATTSGDGGNLGNFDGTVRLLRYDTNLGRFNNFGRAITGIASEDFGTSVGIWEDAQVVRVVIGAPGASNDTGRVEILEYIK